MSNGKAVPGTETVDPRLYLQTLGRALRLLEAFAADAAPQSLAELAAAAGVDKSAAQRICHTLHATGYLDRDAATGGLRPGLKFLDRTFDYLRANPLIERAVPVLAELRAATAQRVDLSLFDDLSMIYAVRLQNRRESFVATLIGRRLPTYCSSGGRAAMAHLPDEEVASLLQRSDRRKVTRHTLTDAAAIRAKVQEARVDEYALTVEEWAVGELAIAAAVTDGAGRPVAAIHVVGSVADWDAKSFRKRIAPLVVGAARDLCG